MKIETWYQENKEHNLQGRYITLEMILPVLKKYERKFEISFSGVSEKKQTIPLVKIGSGDKVILIWSQMHGNESTTTKALFDFLKFLDCSASYQNEVDLFLSAHTLYMVPMLNPDGSLLYTRENANEVDLNRDFQDFSQQESRYLRSLFDKVNPSLCLNMHDQRTIYGLNTGKPATISFLSPSANPERAITTARKQAMKGIVKMNRHLQCLIPGQVGRYDDSFNFNCVGDSFQMEGVPTILFEAGHYPEDYHREKTRELIFYSLLALFDILKPNDEELNFQEYFDIPENQKNFRDVILRNVILPDYDSSVDVSIQYVEALHSGKIEFRPIIDEIKMGLDLCGHREIDIDHSIILTDSKKNLTINVKCSKIYHKNELIVGVFH